MSKVAEFLNPSEAAQRLGVSTKALRLYEQRGLIRPLRTEAGWRTYGPAEMTRAAEIVTLRALGLSLVRIGRVLGGNAAELRPALASHLESLGAQARQLDRTMDHIRAMLAGIERGDMPSVAQIGGLSEAGPSIAIDLPWPWGGERFTLALTGITYLIGPLGCGKTRLAEAIATTVPGALFLGLDRKVEEMDLAQQARVDVALDWLVDEGATRSDALMALLAHLEAEGPSLLVIDLIEHGLDRPTQEALSAYLGRRTAERPPLVVITRSSCVLDLDAVTSNETIILCPANHQPPTRVAPYPGAVGYEVVATCLATPEVRARTEGVIAWRPQVA